MKKRKVLLVLILTMLVLALIGCTSLSSNKESRVLRVAIQPYPLYAPVYVAKELGYFDDYLNEIGVKIKYQSFNSGTLVNESFAAGESDIGVLGDVPAIIARGSGQEIEIISNVAYGEKALAILVSKESDIKNTSQLKGKKVAYVKGSYAHHLLAIVLENEELTFDDIQSVNLSAPDITGAIDNGQVDAGVLWEPYITIGTESNLEKVLVDGIGLKRANLVAIANKDYAENNDKAVEAFLKAYQKACKYINENPEEASKLITKDLNIDTDTLVKIFKNFNYTEKISNEDIAELKKVESFLEDKKLIPNNVDIESLINTTYLDNANKN